MFEKKIKTIIKVDGMSCKHCASKVENELLKIENIKRVKVNLETKEVTIVSKDILKIEDIERVIKELDYKFLGVVE